MMVEMMVGMMVEMMVEVMDWMMVIRLDKIRLINYCAR